MLTFRQTRVPTTRNRSISITSDGGFGETNPLLAITTTDGKLTFYRRLAGWTNSMWRRFLILVIFPVVVTLLWCAVPLPVLKVEGEAIRVDDGTEMNFWFFLFYYYGFYNAIALIFITQVFILYSLNWWPRSVGGVLSYIVSWLFSTGIGTIIYYFTGLEQYRMTWVLLTFLTMALPMVAALILLRSQQRDRFRKSLTVAQRTFLHEVDSRMPSSYRRYLWFCVTLIMTLLGFILGEAYAHWFIDTHSRSSIANVIYIYTWVITVYTLDWITEYIVETRIRSWALCYIFRLYFYMIYFIFYRNLFARLRSIDQVVLIQLSSSIWVVVNYPFRMSKFFHRILVRYFGMERSYEEYIKNVGRAFFIRNIAENVTMLAFLGWVIILNFGPNAKLYPYLQFKKSEDATYTLEKTLWASTFVWGCEIISSYFTRLSFKHFYKHSITREAAQDFLRYPEIVVVMILVIIHVLQDMLLALLELKFA
ncbi:hypothetical protein K493DRAFT_241981 [Basidiobolus meristosporus CBS 931.73]|uniref:Uncharacterized protein n=1 Tax=Basidiobolus meristosporus CBS 931.73 TaxID=1314790 RepID=A0A1Y1X6B9_9FUNG|nr:hypothetical protein K493DRAFT_241981 [Basidiobolus meristosporus CBS 931.73]|eukprot:ORX81347.1 hypothetical protein K493DRAFT_241981 [Basidiobolus meristosporus CBS 931.73]